MMKYFDHTVWPRRPRFGKDPNAKTDFLCPRISLRRERERERESERDRERERERDRTFGSREVSLVGSAFLQKEFEKGMPQEDIPLVLFGFHVKLQGSRLVQNRWHWFQPSHPMPFSFAKGHLNS